MNELENLIKNDNSETYAELSLMNNIIKDNSIVFDVGARDSKTPLLNKNSEYHLFEPISYNVDKLYKEYSSFNNVKINKYCLSDCEEEVEIFKESESINKRLNFTYIWDKNGDHRVTNGVTEKISCLKLVDYIKNNGIKKIDLIKIDVEGYEYKVIKGLEEKINIVNNIIFEYGIGTYSSSNCELKDIVSILSKNFKFYIIENGGIKFLDLTDKNVYEKTKSINYCNLLAKKNE